MEYGWKCFDDEGVRLKTGNCELAVTAVIIALFILLMLLVASFSYAAESLTLEQAVDMALGNNPGLKAADAQVEAADAGVLRSASGFLPKMTVSETSSRSKSKRFCIRSDRHVVRETRIKNRHEAFSVVKIPNSNVRSLKCKT